MATVATPILAGGARRGAAPNVNRQQARGTAALTADEELINQLLGSFAATQAATPVASTGSTVLQSLAEAIGSGSNVIDLGGSTGTTGNTGATGGISAGGVSAVGTGLSALGALMGNQDVAQLGQALGLGGAVAGAQSPGQAAATLGGAALSAAGVPGVGLATNALSGNVAGMVNSALAMASPQLAALNALAGLVSGTTVGSAAAPAASLGLGALSDAAQMALGTAVNAFSTPNTAEEAAAISVTDMGPTSFGETVGQGTQGTTDAMSGGFGAGDTGDGGLGGTEGSGNSGGDNGADGSDGGDGDSGSW